MRAEEPLIAPLQTENGLFVAEITQLGKSLVTEYFENARHKSSHDQLVDLMKMLKTLLKYKVQFYEDCYVMQCSLGLSTASRTFKKKSATGLNECSHLDMANLLRQICGLTPLKSSESDDVRYTYDGQRISAPAAKNDCAISESPQESEKSSTLQRNVNTYHESEQFLAFGRPRAENMTNKISKNKQGFESTPDKTINAKTDFELEFTSSPASFETSTGNVKTQSAFQQEEIVNDTQKEMIYMKQQISHSIEEKLRNRAKENSSVQILIEKNKEIEKLTTINKYLIDVIVDLKRKMANFEQKSVESRDTNQSIYDKISEIQTKLHQNKVEKYDAFRTTNMQQEINNPKTDLIKTNMCTENIQSEIEKVHRKFDQRKIQLQAIEKNIMDFSARLNRTDQTLNVMPSTGSTRGAHERIDHTSSISPPPHKGRNQAPSSPMSPPRPPPQSPTFTPSQSTTTVPLPPPPPPPPSTFNSGRSNTTEPPADSAPPKNAESQTRKPVDDPPQIFEISEELLRTVKSHETEPTFNDNESLLSTPKQATGGIFFSILSVLFLYFVILNYSVPSFNIFTFDLSQFLFNTVLFFSFVINYLIYTYPS